jgi:predicted metal-dependent phosphoesterase TrpH
MSTAWSKADLHVHTTHSDGHAGVEELLEHAASTTDLRVIAITDHDTIEGALAARSMAKEYGIEVVVGEEVTTANGELLALFVEERLPPGLDAAETIAAIHDQGGLAVAAHPYHWLVPSVGRHDLRRRSSGPEPEWPLDAIEAFNAGLLVQGGNRLAAATAGALGLPVLGGSDSHHLGTIGYGYTLFPGRDAASLRAAIEAGRTVATGRRWGFLRTAEVIGLILRRDMNDPACLTKKVRRNRAPSPVGRRDLDAQHAAFDPDCGGERSIPCRDRAFAAHRGARVAEAQNVAPLADLHDVDQVTLREYAREARRLGGSAGLSHRP